MSICAVKAKSMGHGRMTWILNKEIEIRSPGTGGSEFERGVESFESAVFSTPLGLVERVSRVGVIHRNASRQIALGLEVFMRVAGIKSRSNDLGS